ncbi:flagellar hook assembly protein FlgD [Atrimonas thermophila]|uniref:flagellar hook assembly protein FlgD n=1 Tax=Atrimonas thermophila TaxID=3064161 RepID=UPI00399C587B
MILPAESATYYTGSGEVQENQDKRELTHHDFLQLLVCELRYQNPLDPMQGSEFGAQLAQYSTLEEVQNTNSSLRQLLFLEGATLIGKRVLLVSGEEGVVESVSLGEDALALNVGGSEYSLSEVREVLE